MASPRPTDAAMDSRARMPAAREASHQPNSRGSMRPRIASALPSVRQARGKSWLNHCAARSVQAGSDLTVVDDADDEHAAEHVPQDRHPPPAEGLAEARATVQHAPPALHGR